MPRRAPTETSAAKPCSHQTRYGKLLPDFGSKCGVVLGMRVDDDFGRIDGEWKFTKRVFVPVFMNAGAVTGDVFASRSALLEPD
jgi:hypothetical protein